MRIATFVLAVGLAAVACFAVPATESRPNIIFMMVDDLGKEWINCYGGEGIKTPNIDRLAAGGMLFDNAYSMPQCIPTRMCLMTGQYPSTNGWVDHWDPPLWGRAYLDWELNPTVGNILRSAGYKTAVVGKWQMTDTESLPHSVYKIGFDEYFVWSRSHAPKDRGKDGRYWSPRFFHGKGEKDGRPEVFEGKFGPDLEFQFATDFIRRRKDQPFFLYYAFNLVHGPLVATPHEPDPGKGSDGRGRAHAIHAAMVRYMDHLVGEMVKFLEKEKLRDNTIVIWTTDNGSAGSQTNVRNGRSVVGGKTKTIEPGIDAPFIVNCPRRVPAGIRTDALVDFSDMLPTFADFARAKLPSQYKFDGVSHAGLFTGRSKRSRREWIAAMGGKPLKAISQDGRVVNRYYYRDRVIKDGRYKLFIGVDRLPEKLIDLSKDPAEQVNLVGDAKHAAAQKRLLDAANQVFKKVDNEPKYRSTEDHPWDLKPNCVKPPLKDLDAPDRPLAVQPLKATPKE